MREELLIRFTKVKIKITADRIIDLLQDELTRLDISTMPCYVNMGGNSYEDLVDITPDDIFGHLARTGELAKTAAKSPDDYYNFFEPFTGGNKAVIHFAASSGTSAICSHAAKAAESLPNVYVVDTKSLSSGLALLAKYALGLIENGEDNPEKIYESCLEKRKKLQSSFVIDTLECIHKGGRCSALMYYAANLLKIKPVITLDKKTGKMLSREKCKGKIHRVLATYAANTFKKFPNPDLKDLYIIHSCKDEALIKYFVDIATSYYKFENVHVGVTGCNCSIHCGPNTFGLFYFVV